MTSVISMRYDIACKIGPLFREYPCRRVPAVDRVYWIVELPDAHTTVGNQPMDGIDVEYFFTPDEARAWGERDIARRMEVVE